MLRESVRAAPGPALRGIQYGVQASGGRSVVARAATRVAGLGRGTAAGSPAGTVVLGSLVGRVVAERSARARPASADGRQPRPIEAEDQPRRADRCGASSSELASQAAV